MSVTLQNMIDRGMGGVTTKVCTRCGRELPTSAFPGRSARCMACRAEYARERYAEDPTKRLEAGKKWRDANPDKVRAASKRWREEHPDKVRAASKKWREAHPDRVAECQARYREKHPDRVREANKRRWSERRTEERARNARHYAARRQAQTSGLWEKQGGMCYYCGADLSDGYHVDHFIPRARGGPDEPENLVLSCPTCNMKKHTTMPDEFIARLEREREDEGAAA